MPKAQIETERTYLRLINKSDLLAIHELHSLPATDEFNTLGIPTDEEETSRVIEPWIRENESEVIQQYTFAIIESEEETFIGLFGLKLGSPKVKRAEVWYKLHPNYWNKGFGTEVVKAVLKCGFEVLNLHRIEAGCAVDNIGSIKVLEKSGMTREGRKRQLLPLKSGWSDNFIFAILESDFISQNNSNNSI